MDYSAHLMLKELILQGLVPSIVASTFKEGRVFGVVLCHSLHLLIVIGTGQCSQTIGVQLATARIQLGTVILGQLGAK